MEVAQSHETLHGIFDELGSSGYWYPAYPCIWDTHTLSDARKFSST
jgi:hypothetical protein